MIAGSVIKQILRRITGLYMLAALWADRSTVLLGHCAAFHSHAVAPAHFASPGRVPAERCYASPYSGWQKRRRTAGSLQPERYVQLPLN
jgi:hypothetical protein